METPEAEDDVGGGWRRLADAERGSEMASRGRSFVAATGTRAGMDRTTRPYGSRHSDPLTLVIFMGRNRGPFGSFSWASSSNHRAEPHRPHL